MDQALIGKSDDEAAARLVFEVCRAEGCKYSERPDFTRLSLFRAPNLVQQRLGRFAEIALAMPQSRERTFR